MKVSLVFSKRPEKMKKLIKLSETHYIIVDESKIKEGDWAYDFVDKEVFYVDSINKISGIVRSNYHTTVLDGCKRITHSTQRLESKFSSIIYWGYAHISLSEVKEAINGYSVEKLAESANGYSIYGMPIGEKYLAFNEGYQLGFNTHKELVKDKLFTEQDLREAISLAWNYGQKPENNLKDCGNSIVQSLLPKCEWGVELDEQGKLKLL